MKTKNSQQLFSRQLNPSFSLTSWVHLFTHKRFHVLLNSLFKVLFNFPSRYLFSIGIGVIFSLRRSLPPSLGCTLKQPDSFMQELVSNVSHGYGTSTHCGKEPWSEGLTELQFESKRSYINVAPLLDIA